MVIFLADLRGCEDAASRSRQILAEQLDCFKVKEIGSAVSEPIGIAVYILP
jgi:hypothetical protein